MHVHSGAPPTYYTMVFKMLWTSVQIDILKIRPLKKIPDGTISHQMASNASKTKHIIIVPNRVKVKYESR